MNCKIGTIRSIIAKHTGKLLPQLPFLWFPGRFFLPFILPIGCFPSIEEIYVSSNISLKLAILSKILGMS